MWPHSSQARLNISFFFNICLCLNGAKSVVLETFFVGQDKKRSLEKLLATTCIFFSQNYVLLEDRGSDSHLSHNLE